MDWLRFFFALAFVLFPFVYGVGDNSKYGEGRITEDEICPKCGKKFQCYSHGVFEGENGLLQVYAEDIVFCDDCEQSQISPNHHQASISTEILAFQLVRTKFQLVRTCKHLNTRYLIFSSSRVVIFTCVLLLFKRYIK